MLDLEAASGITGAGLLTFVAREAIARAQPMRSAFILLIDLLVAAVAVEAAGELVREFFYPAAKVGFERATVSAVAMWASAVMGAYLVGLYDPAVLIKPRQVIMRSAVVGLIAGLAALLAPYFVWYLRMGRITIVSVIVTVAVTTATWRLLYGRYLERGPRIPVVVLGGGRAGQRLAELVNRTRHTRFSIIGVLRADNDASVTTDSVPVLGTIEEAANICRNNAIPIAVIAMGGELTEQGERALSDLQAAGVRVMSAGTMSMDVAKQLPVEIVSVRWLLDGFDNIATPAMAYAKRVMDVVIAVAGMASFAVLAPLLWVAVKLDSPGPFFFSQPRVGLGGRVFRLYKVRTMTDAFGPRGEAWANDELDRMTMTGRILRQLRLDELPQFWNVLKGEMSVVGPRPEQPTIVEKLRREVPHFQCRHLVKPGITGWAQIHGGYAGSVRESQEKLSYDLYYVRKFNILLDLDIILRTLFVMLARIGAR